MLRTHLAALPAEPDTLIFTAPGDGNGRQTDAGGPIDHSNYTARYFRPVVKGGASRPRSQARFRPTSATSPGRTFATPARASSIHDGANIILVAKRLGHSDPSMTLKRYSFLYPSHEAALADALDATFNGVTPLHAEEAA